MAIKNNSLLQELFVNSYEARLLFSDYNLFDFDENDFKIKTDIEKDLFLIYCFLKNTNTTHSVFNNAIFFFYRWLHGIKAVKKHLLDFKDKSDIFLFFLLLYRDLVIFLILLGQCSYIENEELKDKFKKFKEKYHQIYYIFAVYEKVLTKLESFSSDIDEALVDRYLEFINLVDDRLFCRCLDFSQGILKDEFCDRYGILREKILVSVPKLANFNKKCLIKNYNIKTEEGLKLYEMVLAKFSVCNYELIYSNITAINVYELTSIDRLFSKVLFCIDKFVCWYHFVCSKTYTHCIEKSENKHNKGYFDMVNNHCKNAVLNTKKILDTQMVNLVKSMPKMDMFAFLDIVQSRILYYIREHFFIPNKKMATSLKNAKIKDISIADCDFLFNNITALLKDFFATASKKVTDKM